LLLIALTAFAVSAPSADAQPSTSPAPFERLRLIAPAAPGGGWDQTARVMQDVLQRAGIAQTATVENIPGAAGLIGLARFIGAEQGSPDTLMVSGLIMLGAIVSQQSAVTFRDVLPLARITGEYEAIAVPVASPYRSLADVIRVFREKPESISWGGGSAGGSDQILAGLIADAVGVAPRRVNYIAFSGGGESLSAILGGQVSVGINGLAEFAPQIEAGTLRLLAVSSGERLPGLDVPTLREQGVDVEFENWRSVMAPPGITAADRQRLERAIDAMVKSAEWRDALVRYRWIDRYLAGDAFARFSAAEEARVREILVELGTTNSAERTLSSSFYPLFVLGGLVICLAAIPLASRVRSHHLSESRLHTRAVARTLSGPRGEPDKARPTATSGMRPRSAVLLVGSALVLNLLLVEWAGFVLASTALFWLTARAFDRRHPLRDALYAAGVAVSSYLLFARVLDLPLPAGPLAGWL
jgi:putative tricarboxylic transport membrane protein